MNRIMKPKSVAVIGASAENGKIGNSVMKNLINGGYKGEIYPIHPKADEMRDMLEVIGLSGVGDRPVRELPEGMRKLIDIALALALKPRLVFMDEPTSGVSSREKFSIMDTLVRALDHSATTAIFVEHDMDVVSRYADRVAVWTGGKIALEGTPEHVLNDPDVRKNVIGV
ncbi:MAG: hypothetical protein B7Z40_23225 [Bosea sp. 12-68-7]|nr:MAG: hypothetical protein B7Z40_23225 [Bosea sp. 12-68-7]